jgi:drug/metabolite transporter (DMT)-like permease
VTHLNLALAGFCVLIICIGQILFKYAANLIQNNGGVIGVKTLAVVSGALVIYGGATLLWIYILRFVPVTKAYPLLAMSYVIVPVMGILFLGESISVSYLIGTAFILVGILITTLM